VNTTAPSRPGGMYVVPPAIPQETLAHLRSHRTEAVCFWLGRPDRGATRGATVVEEIWVPRFVATAVSYDVSPDEMLRLKTHLDQTGLFLIAQAHSHPGSAFHSSTDDMNAASPWPGFISIVAPNFGHVPVHFWEAVEVYELLGAGKWHHLSVAECRARFTTMEVL
jgi:proteasome lid subunit RPN8/RPN11